MFFHVKNNNYFSKTVLEKLPKVQRCKKGEKNEDLKRLCALLN